jgi:hypothetical protein
MKNKLSSQFMLYNIFLILHNEILLSRALLLEGVIASSLHPATYAGNTSFFEIFK